MATCEQDAFDAVMDWRSPKGVDVKVESLEIRPGLHVAPDLIVDLNASHGGSRILRISVAEFPAIIAAQLNEAAISLHNSPPGHFRRGPKPNLSPIRRSSKRI
jgi:hypothetical protein